MRIEKLQSLIERALEDPPEWLADFCTPYYSPYYYLMYLLAFKLSPCVAVELGVNVGRGLRAMLREPQCTVYGVDTARTQALDKLMEFPNLHFIQAYSAPVPEQIPHDIKILHIDTVHTYNQAMGEFEAYKSRLANEAVVLFDDLHAANDDVLRYFNQLPYPKIQDDRLHPERSCGYGVVLFRRWNEL